MKLGVFLVSLHEHTKEYTPVTLTDHDLSELLAAVKAGEMTDTVRTSLSWILQQLIEAELTATIGAAPAERAQGRLRQRNGHRTKLIITTAAGDIEIAIPKLRSGSFFPSILERRRRIHPALFAVVMEAWAHGVSTRKVDDLVKALGADTRISKSEVSRICAELDRDLEAFRNRPIDAEFPYVFADATYVKARVRGRVVSRAVVVATGVRADGGREVVGIDVGDSGRRSLLDRLLPVPQGPRTVRCAPGHLRSPPRSQSGHRLGVHRLGLAKMPKFTS